LLKSVFVLMQYLQLVESWLQQNVNHFLFVFKWKVVIWNHISSDSIQYVHEAVKNVCA